MKKEVLRQRMYHLVLYNISPIQQGIQAYHAGIEFTLRYGHSNEYKQWAKYDKTVIILNGGTSNKEGCSVYDEPFIVPNNFGSIEKHLNLLEVNSIKVIPFYEPDLNNATTAIAFLVDERVWDKEKYPADDGEGLTEEEKYDWEMEQYGATAAFLRKFLKQFRLA